MAGLNLQKMQLFLLAFLPLAYTQCTTNNSTADVSNAAISIKPAVAPGYKWSVVASNITFPRSIDFDSQGRLIVLQAAQGLTALDLTADAGVCVREKSRKTFVNLPSVGFILSSRLFSCMLMINPKVDPWSKLLQRQKYHLCIGHRSSILVDLRSHHNHCIQPRDFG